MAAGVMAAGALPKAALLIQYGVAISGGLSVMTAGAWLAWPAATIPYMTNGSLGFNMSKGEASTMVSLMDFGNMVSPIPAGYLMDIVGRKPVILITTVLYIGASLCVLLGHSVAPIFAARFLAGLAKGVAFTVVPIYIAEFASVSIRGGLGTMFFGALNAGVMYAYIIGPYVSYFSFNIANLVIPIISGITFILAPESPYFLIMKNKSEAAIKALGAFRRKPVTDQGLIEEFQTMTVSVQKDFENKGSWKDLVSSPGSRKALLIISVLSLVQRLTGISPTLAYTTVVLPPEGGGASPAVYLIIFSVIFFVCNYLATLLVDTWGRVPILQLSLLTTGLVMAANGVFYLLDHLQHDVTPIVWLPYACLLLFGLTYSLGIGVLPSGYVGELFPANLKGFASGISAILFALMSMIVNKLFQTVQDSVGVYLMYFIFSANSLLAMIFVFFFVFETKGKTFIEIQEILHNTKQN